MSTTCPTPNLPIDFINRMKQLLGDEFESFIASYQDPPSIGLRVNELKLTPEQFLTLSPFPLTPIPWTKQGFTLPAESRPGKHPYHAAGLYYVQDPSAMAVTELLDPQPGERVLDLAAAPGGKSTHIASKMANQGILFANDIHPRRVRDLSNNLERWGVRNAVILNETPARLVDHFGAYFDKVLVDAPCSGEGMFRKDSSAHSEWSLKFVESCAVRQNGILRDAGKLVRPGGMLGYATCTFAPEEDEQTILRFLEENPDFELADTTHFDGFSPGRVDWTLDINRIDLQKTVRLWPYKAPGEGHFIAILQRKQAVFSTRSEPLQPITINREIQSLFDAFLESTMHWRPVRTKLSLLGSYLYLLPDEMHDLRGLRVNHWGWWLGTIKPNRFEPSHALAMALRPEDVQQVFSLSADDPQALAYLHGQVLPSPGPNGWVLVVIDGHPLGWSKRVQNRLKSHSPKWLRWV